MLKASTKYLNHLMSGSGLFTLHNLKSELKSKSRLSISECSGNYCIKCEYNNYLSMIKVKHIFKHTNLKYNEYFYI